MMGCDTKRDGAEGKSRQGSALRDRRGSGGDARPQTADFDPCRPREGREASIESHRTVEFKLEQTSLRIDKNVRLTKSSKGLGWANLFAALTTERPHEALHGAIPALWLATTFTPIDLQRSGIASEQDAVLPENRTSILASGEAVQDEIRSSLEAMHVYLKQEVLDEVSEELYPDRRSRRRVVSVFGSDDPTLRLFMTAVGSSLDQPPQSSALKVEYLSYALAAHLLRSHSTIGAGIIPPKSAEALNSRQLAAIGEYVDSNLSSNVTVGELAAIVGLARSQFLRRFKASTSVSPYQYVMMRRIKKARQYLADPQLDVLSIAVLCGFSSRAHFASTFRRALGVTPGEYRLAI
jgi:AraC family transcriptional regulator